MKILHMKENLRDINKGFRDFLVKASPEFSTEFVKEVIADVTVENLKSPEKSRTKIHSPISYERSTVFGRRSVIPLSNNK